jgi:hypothetical protein
MRFRPVIILNTTEIERCILMDIRGQILWQS